ncbi:hypothetical protein LBMAG56_42130 [Verrucomicrobiota bacterium]|nr:hypothetical protein LBMAG56_42130 [Verrucomicrobiota bacterium]
MALIALPEKSRWLPADFAVESSPTGPAAPIPGRRRPPLLRAEDLFTSAALLGAVPLPEADTLGQIHFRDRQLGRVATADGRRLCFNPEVVLVKFHSQRLVAAVRVEVGQELGAVRTLAGRPDVEFAELDTLQQRAFQPSDPLLTNQWHHPVIGSFRAWEKCRGNASVRIAIVDTPFHMDHPDLAPHVTNGWDVVENVAVTRGTGTVHSTMSAGMAAAVLDNGLGVAGAGNCTILPININGFISEMVAAVYWAATNDVRVVNLSWDGAHSDALNAAGAYLKTAARGLLVMAGVNGSGFLNYPNQPDIWCVSMTDAADNLQSHSGPHIDFAAPGWNIWSTTTGGGYASGSGTSYATPLVAGVVAVLFSLNPTLGPDEVVDILKRTAFAKYGSGWNEFYGWGRIDFGAAADAATATLPVITGVRHVNGVGEISANCRPGLVCSLWRSAGLNGGTWLPVTDAVVVINGAALSFSDPHPPGARAFYRIQSSRP